MKWFTIIVLALLELAAFVAVVRLWQDKRRRWMSKLLWTILFLIPFFGLLLYGFLTIMPDSQADHTEDRIGADGGT